ncbi:MAG: glycosyl transferase family 2 [Bacteroidetes bacterium]|nr:MAG: glycosyl transferase family 2 [Bacteroidota bacterium]
MICSLVFAGYPKKSYFAKPFQHIVILSVIIVNYNVKFFLEQCLCSVRKSILQQKELSSASEIIVVDNHSTDGSLEWLSPAFSEIHFIKNETNTGFSAACNQGLKKATGKYLLFLNPDTILPENFFQVCISFLESNQTAGAVGVRMIDGAGNFLKESKRGFPSPWASFCRLSGISSVFPRSRWFSYYYMGHLNEHQTHSVDVLSGACMLATKAALEKTGGFDENFFMYAEDIDLSYRILKAGFSNYYLPLTTIIHFKGESTRKDRQYIDQFYLAMDQFSQKHMPGNRFFHSILRTAVRVRSGIAKVGQPIRKEIPNSKGSKIVLEGDANSAREVLRPLELMGIKIVSTEEESDKILFCEGPGFPFKKIIEFIDKKKGRKRFRIYAAGSRSFVGSDSSEEPGEAISIQIIK